MLLNLSRVDYLTLTTFTNYDEMLAAVSDLYPIKIAKEVKLGGYQGHQWDGLFLGVGKQRKRAHFILRASGEGAETIFWRTRDIGSKCTRLDLQVTIWLPHNYNARNLYDTLTSPDTEWPGRRLNVSMIQSGDGFDTIYVGSRTSERFARIYVKPDHKGNPQYLRFEMEFKGVVAEAVSECIITGEAEAKTILRAELDRLPFDASRALRSFKMPLGVLSHKVKPESVYGQNKTLDWLETQVESAVIRMLHSHEHGDRMREILHRWVGNSPDSNLQL